MRRDRALAAATALAWVSLLCGTVDGKHLLSDVCQLSCKSHADCAGSTDGCTFCNGWCQDPDEQCDRLQCKTDADCKVLAKPDPQYAGCILCDYRDGHCKSADMLCGVAPCSSDADCARFANAARPEDNPTCTSCVFGTCSYKPRCGPDNPFPSPLDCSGGGDREGDQSCRREDPCRPYCVPNALRRLPIAPPEELMYVCSSNPMMFNATCESSADCGALPNLWEETGDTCPLCYDNQCQSMFATCNISCETHEDCGGANAVCRQCVDNICQGQCHAICTKDSDCDLPLWQGACDKCLHGVCQPEFADMCEAECTSDADCQLEWEGLASSTNCSICASGICSNAEVACYTMECESDDDCAPLLDNGLACGTCIDGMCAEEPDEEPDCSSLTGIVSCETDSDCGPCQPYCGPSGWLDKYGWKSSCSDKPGQCNATCERSSDCDPMPNSEEWQFIADIVCPLCHKRTCTGVKGTCNATCLSAADCGGEDAFCSRCVKGSCQSKCGAQCSKHGECDQERMGQDACSVCHQATCKHAGSLCGKLACKQDSDCNALEITGRPGPGCVSCWEGVCQDPTSSNVTCGAKCAENYDCFGQCSRCFQGTCQQEAGEKTCGKTCSSDSDCIGVCSPCVDGKCAELRTCGAECTTDADCEQLGSKWPGSRCLRCFHIPGDKHPTCMEPFG